MGYRVRLGSVPKWYRERCKDVKSYDEWEEKYNKEDNHACYRPDVHTQLYEIGKYVSFSEEMEDFYSFEIEEKEFKICTKEDLKRIIKWYHQEIKEYYLKLGTEKGTDFESHKRNMLREWDSPLDLEPYYLDEENTDGDIVKSWKLEYAIFNLVYIYRTFDFENEYLIYSGW